MPLQVIDLGRLEYERAYDRQLSVHDEVLSGRLAAGVVLVEHPPVITVSQRPGARRHLLADAARLDELGIEVCETNRGGDITYHGPGQIVAYPILRLADYGLNIGRYMRLLEGVVISTAERFGVAARALEGCTGVWLDRPGEQGLGVAKLAALGIRVRRGVTLHGVALNVTTDLSHFETIVPCGLSNRAVTSMKELLGDDCPSIAKVKEVFVDELRGALTKRRDRA